jgi:hypothetical protein
MPGFGGMLEGDPAEEARNHIPAADAQRAWEEGRAMSVSQALALAQRDT